jgi:hypothetical protein
MKPCHIALILALSLGLAACEGENKGPDARTAVGEILPGSASDAMLPYDTLRSQPPLAPPSGAAGKAKGKGDGADAGPDAAATDSDSAPAPAEATAAPASEPAPE